jgi:hypothetical protein
MLSDQVIELLTAFVDGELSQRQRKAVMRLLHRSSEAREILRQLQENAHRLKQLPRHKVEPSLVTDVLQAIAEVQAQPKQPTLKIGRRRWLPYVAASMAASLLIGMISFLYWKNMIEQDNGPKEEPFIAKIETPEKKIEPQPTPAPRKPNPLVDQMVKGTFGEFIRQVPDDVPFSATFAELQNAKKDQLARELKNEKEVRFDITVKNNPDALVRLKDVLRDRKIDLVTDASAAKALKDKKQEKVEYLVFAENLTTDELTKLMGELSQNYVVGMNNNQKMVASPYKRVTVTPIAKDDKQKLTKLLGEPTDAKPDPKSERKAVVLPVNANGTPSAEVAQFVKQRRTPQAGTIQVLIRIRQE